MGEYNEKMAKVHNALNECGIGEKVQADLGADMTAMGKIVRAVIEHLARQAIHNRLVNVPTGLRGRRELDTPAALALEALPGAIGSIVDWDINKARQMAAGILEDVNLHSEAAIVQGWIGNEQRATDADADSASMDELEAAAEILDRANGIEVQP